MAVGHSVPPRLSRLCPALLSLRPLVRGRVEHPRPPRGVCLPLPAADTRRSPLPLPAAGAPGFAVPQLRGSTVLCQLGTLPPSPSSFG